MANPPLGYQVYAFSFILSPLSRPYSAPRISQKQRAAIACCLLKPSTAEATFQAPPSLFFFLPPVTTLSPPRANLTPIATSNHALPNHSNRALYQTVLHGIGPIRAFNLHMGNPDPSPLHLFSMGSAPFSDQTVSSVSHGVVQASLPLAASADGNHLPPIVINLCVGR